MSSETVSQCEPQQDGRRRIDPPRSPRGLGELLCRETRPKKNFTRLHCTAPPARARRPTTLFAAALGLAGRAPRRMTSKKDSSRSAAAYPALSAFLAHSTVEYHMEELPVAEARPALLEWYRATRRRLPWRGDAPPYNGSTAGFAQRAAASSTL